MAEPTTHDQPVPLVVRMTGPHGRGRNVGLRTAALMVGYLAGADSDEIWLDLRAGHTFEVGDDTFVPLYADDITAVI